MHRNEPREVSSDEDPRPSRMPESAGDSPHAGDVTLILASIEQGQPQAADQLLPLVYDELRKLATARMAQERPGQTLQATALVHEAYIRLVDTQKVQHWHSRGHFFAAAAEAMRRILVENARRKARPRHGGGQHRVPLDDVAQVTAMPAHDLLDLDEALERLGVADPVAAEVVKLRCFAGLTMPQTAESLGLSLRNTERNWTYARTWLHRELERGGSAGSQ